jgi:hypothetical protein
MALEIDSFWAKEASAASTFEVQYSSIGIGLQPIYELWGCAI